MAQTQQDIHPVVSQKDAEQALVAFMTAYLFMRRCEQQLEIAGDDLVAAARWQRVLGRAERDVEWQQVILGGMGITPEQIADAKQMCNARFDVDLGAQIEGLAHV